ncbi:MAG: NUDIX domain-containing protein [Myxococcota bacterium]
MTVLVFRGDRILAMKRAAAASAGAGVWEGVSGRVEPGEDPLAAARREVIEESGLSVSLLPRPVDTYAARRNQDPMTVLVFRAAYDGGIVTLSHEHDDYRWCTVDEFNELGAPPRLVRAARTADELGDPIP